MTSTTEQVWQGVATNPGDSEIGTELLQLDLAAFPVKMTAAQRAKLTDVAWSWSDLVIYPTLL
jgi:hypothetical protein